MKTIKNLGLKSLEGFEVKNLQRFPSMEWGDEGGMTAEVYLKGTYIGKVYQEGNGGCAIVYKATECPFSTQEINQALLDFLKRNDKDYTDLGKYDWLKNKTVKDIDDDDFECLVNIFETRYDEIKRAKAEFKNGFDSVAIVYHTDGLHMNILRWRVPQIGRDAVDVFMKTQLPKVKYNEVSIFDKANINAAF